MLRYGKFSVLDIVAVVWIKKKLSADNPRRAFNVQSLSPVQIWSWIKTHVATVNQQRHDDERTNQMHGAEFL